MTFVKVYANHPAGSIEPAFSWFNPFAMNFNALIDGVLLGVFIYWGWDSGVAVNEESEDSNEGPGRAAVMSTIVLVLIYVIVSAAGPGLRRHRPADQRSQPERRAERARLGRVRLPLGQAADHRGAHLGVGLDADDDPADGAHHAVDGLLEGDPAKRSGTSTRAT